MNIERNCFDSEHFGLNVGSLDVAAEESPTRDELAAQMVACGWQMVTIKSSSVLSELKDSSVGALITLEGALQTFRQYLESIQSRHVVEPLTNQDWNAVRRLQENAGRTRFSKDKHFSSEQICDHKMKMLRHYQQQNPRLSVAVRYHDGLAGFQVSRMRADSLDFYEVVVDPSSSDGFVAVDLFRDVVARATRLAPNCSNISTRIYADNIRSLKFFERLGMQRVDTTYYYHLWL